jgi:hypothetical protein
MWAKRPLGVAGCRQHVEVISGTLGVGFSVYGSKQTFINLLHDGVGPVVIIAEKRRLVEQLQAQWLRLGKICGKSVQQLIPAQSVLGIDVGFNRRKTVGDRTDSAALNVVGIVTRTTVVIVSAPVNTIGNNHG